MAKTKNKKRQSADQIHRRKELSSKKVMNPFEVHINREKMRVIGKKQQKFERGLPGVSRSKAIQKRKQTLLPEYKLQHKSNLFLDKRIGEKNMHMTDEDKITARFTAQRVKQHKKSIFNLADDEVLTHKGQTLSEIEKFEDPRSEDEDNDDDLRQNGKLDSDFVGEAHFGGGMLRRTGEEGVKTHRELIDQLIFESKKRKAEKQKLKETTMELTEKLDTDWKDLLPLVSKSRKTAEDLSAEKEKTKVDDYDKAMRELKFEARGGVSDRLKTEDEVAKEEREKLEELEKERLERMNGFVKPEKAKQPTHRSADDLDDDIVYEADPEYTLSYNEEGQSNVPVSATINGKEVSVNKNDDDEEQESGDDEEGSEGDDEQESSEEESDDDNDSLDDLKEDESGSEQEEEKLENAADKSDEEEDAEIDKKDEEEKSDENCDNKNVQSVIVEEKMEDLPNPKKKTIKKKPSKSNETAKEDSSVNKDIPDDLPFTFELPDSYESLSKLLEDHPSNLQSTIIERMIKCNHPSLNKANKENLGLLFAYLLQHLNDKADALTKEEIQECFTVFISLIPQIFELAQLNPENAHTSMLEVIKEKHGEYRKKKKHYPGIEILLFLKLVHILFTTSDFRHQVVTPCFLFMEQLLMKCRVEDCRDISYGLFVSTLVLQYTKLSKRYHPATICFLNGLLHLAIPKSSVKLVKVLPPFKPIQSNLVLVNSHSESDFNLQMKPTDLLASSEIDDNFKIRALYTTIKLLTDFLEQLKPLYSCPEIYSLTKNYLEQIPISLYPQKVQEAYNELKTSLKTLIETRELHHLVQEASKPKALRLYEPKIVEIYDYKSHRVQSKEKMERDKLLHKLKSEKKGALREIRRDRSFLAQVKIKQQLRSDQERKEKVKRIFSEASIQQSELNAIDRKKKRK